MTFWNGKTSAGSESWEPVGKPCSLAASSCPPEEQVGVFTLSVNGDNVKHQQFSCVFKMSGSAGGLPIPYRASGKRVSSFDWHFKKKHNAHSCFCWSPAALCVFSTEQVREGSGGGERVGGPPAPAIRHPSAINRESHSVWFMRFALVASSMLASFKSRPSPLFFHLLCKLICCSLSPHWLVFRAPSPIWLLIPQAFLCLSCHVFFKSSQKNPLFRMLRIQSSADSSPTFKLEPLNSKSDQPTLAVEMCAQQFVVT